MPKFDDAAELVRLDVEEGIGSIFLPQFEDAFRVDDVLDGDHFHTDAEPEVIAVPWIYEGVHTGDLQGLFPTGRAVTIFGVTFVDDRGAERLFHRHVDWLGVFTQLGLELNWRVPVDEDEYRTGRKILKERRRREEARASD